MASKQFQNILHHVSNLNYGQLKKLRHEVEWTPKYDLNSGIDQTIQWWKDKLDRDIIES